MKSLKDRIGYTPAYATVTVRGKSGEFVVRCSVAQGIAMEADGISVDYIHSVLPAWAVFSGLAPVANPIYRMITWPSRWAK